MLDPQKIWQGVLGELELLLSKVNFTTWFKNTFIIEVNKETGEVLIGVPNAFTKSWMEKKYNAHILKALNNVCNSKIKNITYQIQSIRQKAKQAVDAIKIEPVTGLSSINTETAPEVPFGLNKRYIFENFIVGAGNQLAHSASLAVTEEPGTRYNPLFLYGDVGLGKTHLMQAIGHTIKKNKPKAKVIYANFEKFTNDYVAAVRKGSFDDFRATYRKADVLLVMMCSL